MKTRLDQQEEGARVRKKKKKKKTKYKGERIAE